MEWRAKEKEIKTNGTSNVAMEILTEGGHKEKKMRAVKKLVIIMLIRVHYHAVTRL